ncbi:AAA family ATPase [Alkalimonas sp. MEB108]|uniref:AAA family ATPase n=1 Tax=Alkalimonas cellulosilytica TaxID=3058395 RepID=A0ABU7J9T5_9GAMM|nr:AAA family ATPase [Alkalimonas sp. MEB108]MEE2003252.1 AAA family ATPase [Alkalimonas sp. MEB108]
MNKSTINHDYDPLQDEDFKFLDVLDGIPEPAESDDSFFRGGTRPPKQLDWHNEYHEREQARPNRFAFEFESLFLSEKNPAVAQLTDQIAFITVSQSIHAGIFTQFQVDETKLQLVPCDETMILAAIMGLPKLLARIASKAGKSAATLIFPQAAQECRNALKDNIIKRTFAIDGKGTNQTWFYYAANIKHRIMFTTEARALLSYLIKETEDEISRLTIDEDNLALFFQGRYPFQSQSEALAEICRFNRHKPSVFYVHQQIQQLKKTIQTQIKGQQSAIQEVTSMIASAFSNPKKGPLGIATFMGAPGAGKTALAEAMVDGINQVFAANYQKLLLNMELYTDARDVSKLFGSGSQYVDSSLGDLTSAVSVHPRTVIIFDEIEKAHPAVIQSLLTLLEKGEVADYTSNKVVDFSQCLFVFTTNLGYKTNSKVIANDTLLDLKTLLAGDAGKASLSPELISRLSRGHVVYFHPLTPNDLLEVAELAASFVRSQEKAINWPENFAELIVETLGGNLEPRSIHAQGSKLQRAVMEYICTSCDTLPTHPRIEVDIPEDLTDYQFAVISTDKQLKARFKRKFPNCMTFSSLSKIEKLMDNATIQAVLIHRPLLDDVTEIPDVHELKFYSFNILFEVESLPKIAGLNKHYALPDFGADALDTLVKQTAKRTRLLRKVNEYQARNMAVAFEYQMQQLGTTFKVSLVNPRYEVLFSPKDFEPSFMQQPCIPTLKFDDLHGLKELKQQMTFVLKRLRNEHDFQLDMPKGYLLAGSPGTGKSYFAKAVAGECKVPFIPVNSADLMVGNVVQNINHLFDTAERYAPCILFFDEIDAIAMSRKGASHFSISAVNTLLTRLDGFNNSEYPVFIMAATNSPSQLDPAVIRYGRFDKVVTIPAPDLSARKQFMRQCADEYGFTLSDHELGETAKRCGGATFGFLRAMFREIQLQLISSDKSFQPKMLNEHLLTHQLGQKKQSYTHDEQQRLQIAYHETGHYLLTKNWSPDAHCVALSIEEFEHAGGVTQFDVVKQHNVNTRASVDAQLQILLAGRAAEELYCQHEADITNGASSDIKRATELARCALTHWGLSTSLGIADFSQLPTLQARLESEVLHWLETAYKASKQHLEQNWDLVAAIANELHKKQTLTQSELDALTSDCRHGKTSLSMH